MKILLGRINFYGKMGGHPRDVFMPFELSMLSTLLKKENKVTIKDNDVLEKNINQWKEILARGKWELVILKLGMDVMEESVELLANFKRNNPKSKLILLGFENKEWFRKIKKESRIDRWIWGDAEKGVLDFLEDDKTKANKISVIDDLDKLPFYDHKSFLGKNYVIYSKSVKVYKKIRWGFLLTSRGCPFNCKFCSSNIRNSQGKFFRAMSAGRIYRELDYMINKLKINAVSFEDDIFTMNRKRVVDLCNKIIQKKLKFSWVVSTRADCLDEELIKLMKRAGCDGMAIGVESGSNRILKSMGKGEKAEEIKNKLLLLRKIGIAVTANVIVGYPGETELDFRKTMRLLKESKVVLVHAHYLTLYPDTLLYSEYKEKIKKNKYNHRIYGELNLSKMKEKELVRGAQKIYKNYYLSWNYWLTYWFFRWQYWIFNPNLELKLLLRTEDYLLK